MIYVEQRGMFVGKLSQVVNLQVRGKIRLTETGARLLCYRTSPDVRRMGGDSDNCSNVSCNILKDQIMESQLAGGRMIGTGMVSLSLALSPLSICYRRSENRTERTQAGKEHWHLVHTGKGQDWV